jgi:hypothetical protein
MTQQRAIVPSIVMTMLTMVLSAIATISCTNKTKPLSIYFVVDASYAEPGQDLLSHHFFISNGFELTTPERKHVDKLRDSLIYTISERVKSYRNVSYVSNVQAVSYYCQSYEEARQHSSLVERRMKEDRGADKVETIYISSPY